jgi:error-prone DNA polymerase
MSFVHLHVRSWFSFQRGASSPEALVKRALELGQPALALTDFMGVAGVVQFQQAAQKAGIKPIIGAEIVLKHSASDHAALELHPLVFLAASNAGYATLCRFLSRADERKTEKKVAHLEWSDLADDHADLFCLTAGRDGFLRSKLEAMELNTALEWVKQLSSLMPGRVFVELVNHRRPGEKRMLGKLAQLARTARVPLVATNDVRFAARDDFALHDLLTCSRLGLTIDEEHDDRPVNDEARLKSLAELQGLIYQPSAFANTLEIARECSVNLLPGEITPPGANLPAGVDPRDHLESLCRAALAVKFSAKKFERPYRLRALNQLDHELDVIAKLELSEFFLVVHEVIAYAKARGIRCAGRGSAANSIVAYLLGITGVDPLEHRLLFERFLHTGRRGTPDIDVDFQSDRRLEVIAWLEDRFAGHTAMTANVNTYQPRSAVRDAAKVLGWPLETIDRMTKALPYHGRCCAIKDHRMALESVTGPSTLLEVLLEVVTRMDGCPRHLSQHSGGMLLTRDALTDHTPIIRSANGVKTATFAKDDVESMGLVKFDVLGLRSLGVVSRAVELHQLATGELLLDPTAAPHGPGSLEVDDIRLDDPRVFDLICSGGTLALFQVESPGQIALIAKHQPRDFKSLIAQIALLRPGPLQGGMVHPYVRRARGLEPVVFAHHSLEQILDDTYGIILYQEQVLEVAHAFAGLSLEQADEFRRLMSKWRHPGEMSAMKDQFISSAMNTHADLNLEAAEEVFFHVSQFVGYGFPRSHAAAFAKTVYQTAFLKLYFPAAYLAAVMEHHPGMYPRQSFVLEAQRAGVTVLPPSLEHSSLGFSLEMLNQKLAIRLPLEGITGIGTSDAQAILLERLASPFSSLESLWRRVRVGKDVLQALAKAGALETFGPRREIIWQLGVLESQFGQPGLEALDFETPAVQDIPDLELLNILETLVWDHTSIQTTTGLHPMALVRSSLTRSGVQPIARAHTPRVTVSGLVIARQRPPTAKGITFITLEDETGRVQCIVHPGVWERIGSRLKARALVLTGSINRVGSWRGITVENGWPLEMVAGDQTGRSQFAGGRAGPPRA